MKVELIIKEATTSELQRILAALSGSTAITTSIADATATEDDESGDTPVAAGSFDKDGLPWDDRIHSTPAKLTSKGVWRAKRGVQDGFVKTVEAELRAKLAASQYQPQPVPQQQPYQPPMQQPAPMQQQPAPQYQPQQMPYTPPASVEQQQQPAPQYQPQPVPQQMQVPTFPDGNSFMAKIASLCSLRDQNNQPWVDAAYLSTVANRHGLAAITDVISDPSKIPGVVQTMMNDGKWVN